MATRELHLSVKMIGRSSQRSPVAAAAYRSGQRLEDERQGKVWNYRRSQDILGSGIMAPEQAPVWATDRARLWNEVDKAETRKNSQTAREVVLALPHELGLSDNIGLLDAFLRTQFVDRGMVADWSIHRPDKEGDQRNIHAHIMLTTREIGPDGFGKKAREWNDKALVQEWRAQWADHQNKALAAHGVGVRIEHRSFKARGIDRAPHVHEGPKVSAMERRGQRADRTGAPVLRILRAQKGQRRREKVFYFSHIAQMSRRELNRHRTISARERYEIAADRMGGWWSATFKMPLQARETFVDFCMAHGLNNALGTAEKDPERLGGLRQPPEPKNVSAGQKQPSSPYSVAPPLPQDGGRGDTTPKKAVSSPSAAKEPQPMARKSRPTDLKPSVSFTIDPVSMEKEIEAPKRGLFDTKHARHERAAILLRSLFIERYGVDKHRNAMHKFVAVADRKGFAVAFDKLRHFPRELGSILPHVKDISAKTRREERRRHAAERAEVRRQQAAQKTEEKRQQVAARLEEKKQELVAKAEDQARQVRPETIKPPTVQKPNPTAPNRVGDVLRAITPKPQTAPKASSPADSLGDPLAKIKAKRAAAGQPQDRARLLEEAQERARAKERDKEKGIDR